MALGSVAVIHPLRRLVYINGNYLEAAGLSPGPFAVQYGDNTFETRNGDGRVDYEKTVTVRPDQRHLKIELNRV